MGKQSYIAIDLKSFFASVECVERGLDPLTTNLVVADPERTQKTICLAVTPALKAYGIGGRARLFEVVSAVKRINSQRASRLRGKPFTKSSYSAPELQQHPEYELDYIVAPPRMSYYMEYSTRIYDIYLRYVAPEDMHVYSIDEVFIDVTHYLRTYRMSACQLASRIMSDILKETGITATAGIGTNMYLCKVAMDIVAKHAQPDKNGARMAELDEQSYRRLLWGHRPISDFWRVGAGYRKKLEAAGLYTMGDVARCSIGRDDEYYNEELLYKMFGINAELLIDHAWGYEPVTMQQVKAYKPQTNSISSGQVLHCPYDVKQARLIVQEMTDLLVLELVEKRVVTSQLVLTVGYDVENLTEKYISSDYSDAVTIDRYGRRVPKHAHGSVNLKKDTSSTRLIMDAVMDLYDKIVNPRLLVRRMTITANKLKDESKAAQEEQYEQLELFTDTEKIDEREAEKHMLDRERKLQEAVISIKKRYGKNAMLKGMNLQEGATAIDRNSQIGGHKA